MAEKFNRDIFFSLTERGSDTVRYFGSAFGKEEEEFLPYEITANIQKSITSNLDTCSLTIQNHISIEEFFDEPDIFITEFASKNFEVTVFLGYGDDFQQVFSGDLVDITVAAGSQLTDQSITLSVVAGELAAAKSKIKKVFPAGETYRAIVEECFLIMLIDWDIELEVLDDPFKKLDKEIKKTTTKDRYVFDVLNDISRDLDMTWGIDSKGETNQDFQKGFFVDKRSTFDVAGVYGRGEFDISYETGLLSLPSMAGTEFNFRHRYDPRLNIGVAIGLSVQPKVDSTAIFHGRINSIHIAASNKGGEFSYTCAAQFTEVVDNEILAKLNFDRRNVGSEAI